LDFIGETTPFSCVLELEEFLFLPDEGLFSSDIGLVGLFSVGKKISKGARLIQVVLQMLSETRFKHIP
jgi:hypothetical protein